MIGSTVGWTVARRRRVLVASLLGAAGLQVIDRLRFARLPMAPIGGRIGDGAPLLGDLLLTAVGVDVAVLFGLVLVGGLLLPRELPLGATRPVLALVAGASLHVVVSLLLLPAVPSLAVLVVASVLVNRWLGRSGRSAGWRRDDAVPLAATLVATVASAVVVRSRGLVILSADSSEYWDGARLLATGALGPADLDVKRMLAVQALHAPGIALGTDGIISVGLLLLVGAVVLLATAPHVLARVDGRAVRASAVATGVALATVVAASSWFWFNAIYLNVHLFVAVLLLAIGLLIAASGRDGLRVAMPVLVLLIAALTLARAESALIVGGLLIGTTSDATRWRDWWPAWRTLGAVLIVWNGLLVAGAAGSPPLVASVGLAIGGFALLAPTLLDRIPDRLRARLPLAVALVLWTAALAVPLTPPGRGIVFFEMVRLNLGDGEGAWYLTAPLLFVLAVYAVVATADARRHAPVRWLVILFVPLTMLAKLADGSEALEVGSASASLEVLLSGGGRPKWGDSVNRMWTHVALAVVLLGLTAAVRQDGDTSAGRRALGRRSALLRVAPLVLALVLVASWWRPDVGPDGPVRTTVLTASVGDRPGPALTDGTVLVQTIVTPGSVVVPDDATLVEVCFEVALTVPGGGRADGRFALELSDAAGSARREYRGAAQADGAQKDVCLPTATPLPATFTATVRGLGGSDGRVVAVLTDPEGAFVREARLVVAARSLDPRGPLARGVSWTIRRLVTWGPLAFGAALLVTLLPVSGRSGAAPRTTGSADRGPR